MKFSDLRRLNVVAKKKTKSIKISKADLTKSVKSSITKRIDPLHVPSADLVVSYKGREVLVLNKRLIDQQNCWDKVSEIKALHERRLEVEEWMSQLKEDSPIEHVEQYNNVWSGIQFQLQKAWGFTEDAKFHRFWDIPGCRCAKLDNNDSYPTGYYSISGGCNIHGRNLKRG